MELMIAFGKWCAHVTDYVLGWMLALPHDPVVFFVALATVLLLTIGRLVLTNQNLMHRCEHDLNVLHRSRAEAIGKRSGRIKLIAGIIAIAATVFWVLGWPVYAWLLPGLNEDAVATALLAVVFGLYALAIVMAILARPVDPERVKNIDLTIGGIQLKQMGAELKGLLIGIVPIIFLASWAFERLEFVPPTVGQEFHLRVTYPLDDCGKDTCVEITPKSGKFVLCPETSAVQIVKLDDNRDPFTSTKIVPDTEEGPAKLNGLAEWTIKAVEPGEAVVAVYRGDNPNPIDTTVRAGGRLYGDPIVIPTSQPWANATSTLVMERALFLEWIPGLRPFWNWYRDVWNWQGPPPPTSTWSWVKVYILQMPGYVVSRVTFFPPWLLAYVCLTIPLIPLTRKMMRVA